MMLVRFVALAVGVLVGITLPACRGDTARGPEPAPAAEPTAPAAPPRFDPFAAERYAMVEHTVARRGITDPRVLDALRLVPRHEFVPPDQRDHAYADSPLSIGLDSTISQPYIVAVMTEAARVRPGHKVLEIGTGSGYQAAVLAAMGAQVYTIEIGEELATRTRAVLANLGYGAIQLKAGDGYFGWRDAAPFDAILLTTAPPRVPDTLLEQLAVGGRLVGPIGDGPQWLEVHTKRDELLVTREVLMEVNFGRMTGMVRRVR
jgi:protein-L-isoaspartate(D-aspartate) O-methyltransferase